MNISKRLVRTIIIGFAMFFLMGCTKHYEAETTFGYRIGTNGKYYEWLKEVHVGETLYMTVRFHVTTNKKDVSYVKATLTIPNSDKADITYFDGQPITPDYDPVQNVTTYEFTINASKNSAASECIIKFSPYDIGIIQMTLVYDENVDPSYDVQNTIEIVENEEVKAFVSRLYRICLGREPDKEGLNNWVQALISGEASGARVVWGFFFSREMENMNLTDEDFIIDAYLAIFDRDPDKEGKTEWKNYLKKTSNRSQLINGFLGSEEFGNLCEQYGIKRY